MTLIDPVRVTGRVASAISRKFLGIRELF